MGDTPTQTRLAAIEEKLERLLRHLEPSHVAPAPAPAPVPVPVAVVVPPAAAVVPPVAAPAPRRRACVAALVPLVGQFLGGWVGMGRGWPGGSNEWIAVVETFTLGGAGVGWMLGVLAVAMRPVTRLAWFLEVARDVVVSLVFALMVQAMYDVATKSSLPAAPMPLPVGVAAGTSALVVAVGGVSTASLLMLLLMLGTFADTHDNVVGTGKLVSAWVVLRCTVLPWTLAYAEQATPYTWSRVAFWMMVRAQALMLGVMVFAQTKVRLEVLETMRSFALETIHMLQHLNRTAARTEWLSL